MKVMVLSSYAPTLFYFREDMMQSMKEAGHEIVAVAPESEEEWQGKFFQKGISYRSIKGLERTGTNPITDIKGLASIIKVIKQEKPDKIFSYQAKTVIYGSIAAKLSGVKGIYAMMGGLGSIMRSEKVNVVGKVLRLQYKLAFNFCDNVFFQNEDDVQVCIDANLISRSKVVKVNGSGVNLNKFSKFPLPEKKKFLLIARIIKDKGILEYLEAAKVVKARYPDAKFQLLGYFDTNPTAISPEVIEEYEKAGVIEYLGKTNDVAPYLKECYTYVLPSYHEGTPKSVLEAMATGRPIITTDVPGCRETVVHEENGFLIPAKNHEELAKAMIRILDNETETERMANASYKICVDKFDVVKVNDKILKEMCLV